LRPRAGGADGAPSSAGASSQPSASAAAAAPRWGFGGRGMRSSMDDSSA
jgi:hypothetical protein